MKLLFRAARPALCLVALACGQVGLGAVFQYSLPVETRKGERDAFLWIPSKSTKVKGVITGGLTLMEREFVKDPVIRKACADSSLALLFLKTGLKSVDLQAVLDQFAKHTGYEEISTAPLFFIGHSAGGPQARDCARQWHKRCFGLFQFRGLGPGGEEPVPPGVPALMIVGQFDEFGKIGRDANNVENWEKDRDYMTAYRKLDPANLGSFLVEPGAGHFPWSDRCATYLAQFITKAAQARIPDNYPKAPLKTIDPASGYLTDLHGIRQPGHPPALHAKYTGDKSRAAWHFDYEMAFASLAFHEGIGRADQFLLWKDDHWVQSGARNFLTNIKWVDDGQTFEVAPVYAKTYPGPYKGRGSVWGKAGQPVGKAETPIQVRSVSGPLVAAGKHRLRFQYDPLAPATENRRVTFLAYSNGDARHRYTERVGMFMEKHYLCDVGKPQNLTFKPIGDLTANSPPAMLRATSSAGLPVEFHVAYGPAVINQGKLKLTEMPAKAKFPIELKVVAYQFGRGLPPLVQRATPVEQTLLVTKP